MECSAREQLLPEADFGLLQNRFHSIESEAQNLAFLLEQRERDCELLRCQLRNLQGSHSWKVTAPLRAFVDFLRLAFR